MVLWLLLLRIFWRGKLSRKLESLSQSHPMVPQALLLPWLHLVLLRLGHCHPMVAQHLRALAELLSVTSPRGACSHVHQKRHHRHTCLRDGAPRSQLRCGAFLAVWSGRVGRRSTNELTEQN